MSEWFQSFMDDVIDRSFSLQVADPRLPEIRIFKKAATDNLSAKKIPPAEYVFACQLARDATTVRPGAIELARWILDNPEAVRGTDVLDVGAGAAVVAIAAKKAGAKKATALDKSIGGSVFSSRNAVANSVDIHVVRGDFLDPDVYNEACVITAAEIFYNAKFKDRLREVLNTQAKHGKLVLVAGDETNHFLSEYVGEALRSESLNRENIRLMNLSAA